MSIEPSVVVFTIINFILFTLIVNGLLFKPMLRHIHERNDRIRAGKEAGEKASKIIAESEELARNTVSQCKSEQQTRAESIASEQDDEIIGRIADAENKANEERKSQIDSLISEQNEIENELSDNIGDYANIVAKRIEESVFSHKTVGEDE